MDNTAANPDGEGAHHFDGTVRRLNVRVTDQLNEVHFAVRGSTKLAKVMDRFCASQGKNPATVRFWFDGERIRDDQTPDQVSCAIFR